MYTTNVLSKAFRYETDSKTYPACNRGAHMQIPKIVQGLSQEVSLTLLPQEVNCSLVHLYQYAPEVGRGE